MPLDVCKRAAQVDSFGFQCSEKKNAGCFGNHSKADPNSQHEKANFHQRIEIPARNVDIFHVIRPGYSIIAAPL